MGRHGTDCKALRTCGIVDEADPGGERRRVFGLDPEALDRKWQRFVTGPR